MKRLSLTQGNSKVTRDLYPVFNSQLPPDSDKKICVWVRDGWSIDENSVRADARQAGNQSPLIFVFIPKRSADDLRHHLINYKAATATLDKRGVPNTPEGTEARSAMETTKQAAEGKIEELLSEAFSGARVFQGGGNEILGNNLQEMILEAAENALSRLYPHFHIADHQGWDKVYAKAKQGSPDALKAVGFENEPAKNGACKAILGFIAGGKKGCDIRAHFEASPFGWSRDAVDGGLQVLLVAGLLRAQDERGQVIDPRSLERKAIGKAHFKVESATVTTVQRIQVRKLLQKIGCQAKQGEELAVIPEFLQKMQELADRAGGDAPKPERPDTTALDELRLTSGNEQILSLYNRREELKAAIDNWNDLARRIEKRWPEWEKLGRLIGHADGIADTEVISAQVKHIEKQRLLLSEPDPIAPLIQSLTQLLRDELNKIKEQWQNSWDAGQARLEQDENWQQLSPEQRYSLRASQQLIESATPDIQVEDTEAIIRTLNKIGISALRDRIAAMPSRFEQLIIGAAELMEPEAQFVRIPRRTLKTVEDLYNWTEDIKRQLKAALEKGPVIIR